MKTVMLAAALWGMARPVIMASVVLVYANGLLVARAAGAVWDWNRVWWGLAALLLVSVSIHYTNEYADYETDALTTPTWYSGGSGVLARGLAPRGLALQAAWVTLILGVGIAMVGLALGLLSPAVVVMLLLGAAGGWMYSLPPLKLAWRGWGELDNALLGGLLLHLYGVAVLGVAITPALALGFGPFTLLTFNNLLATTWADRAADAQVGKYTLATRWPVARLRGLYAAAALAAFGSLPWLAGWALPPLVAGAGLLALPVVWWGWRTYTRMHAPYPTSNAMVVFLAAQMAAWWWLGG